MASFYLDDYRLISVRKSELALTENLKLLVNNIEVKFNISDDVDYVYNTSLIYEIGVLKLYAEPLLFGIDNTSPYYEEVIRLLNFLGMFVGIPTDEIPSDSILREFIGGSYFE